MQNGEGHEHSESYGVQYLVLAQIFSSDRLEVRQILLPLVPLNGYIQYIELVIIVVAERRISITLL